MTKPAPDLLMVSEIDRHRCKRYRMLAECVKMEWSRSGKTGETTREYALAEAVTWLLDERRPEQPQPAAPDRDAIVEECARIVEGHYWDTMNYEGIGQKHGASIAKMIRALKGGAA